MDGAEAAAKVTDDDTEEFAFDMSMKKKKKKKKKSASGGETAEGVVTATTEEQTGRSEEGPAIEEAAPGTGGGADEEVAFEDQSSSIAMGANPSAGIQGSESWLTSDRDYTYQELLGRVFGILRQNNPDLAGDRRKFTIIPPIIGREGSKKTAFTNISELCRRMRRPVEHVTSFLLTEMGTTGSIDANQRLIIKGRFQQLQVENLLRRYIGEYVTCKTCRSPETQLVKENRLFFMKCDSCGSSRSVAAIKAGFKAQTGRRIRAA